MTTGIHDVRFRTCGLEQIVLGRDDGSMTKNTQRVRRDRIQAHYARAVTEAEIRRLSRALAPFGVLGRDALRKEAGAEHWQEGSFEQAVAAAAREGRIQALPGDFYRDNR